MPPVKSEQNEPAPIAPPPAEEVEETWEEKEDKLDAENIQPTPATPTEQKYQYKEGLCLKKNKIIHCFTDSYAHNSNKYILLGHLSYFTNMLRPM